MFSTLSRLTVDVNLFLRSVSAFSPRGYEVIGSVAQPSSVKVPNIVSEGFDKCEVFLIVKVQKKQELVFCLDFQPSQRMVHYKMARRYRIKMATRFTAAVWLELGLAQTCEFIV